MSANRYQAHVLVLPEDDANRDLVIGFRSDASVEFRRIQVEDVAGGWRRVLELFQSDYLDGMRANALRCMVLLFDFEVYPEEWVDLAKAHIPDDVKERVFILGALTTPEELKARLGSYETIGKAAAKDCRDGTDTTWGHALLKHNANELDRLRQQVRPILFPSVSSR